LHSRQKPGEWKPITWRQKRQQLEQQALQRRQQLELEQPQELEQQAQRLLLFYRKQTKQQQR
jgi:hypothetical protein